MAARFVNGSAKKISFGSGKAGLRGRPPTAAREGAFIKEAAQQLNIGLTGGIHHDTHDIITERFFGEAKEPAVDAGGLDDVSLFPEVDGGLGEGDERGRPRLDLDEGQRVRGRRAVVGDDVDLRGDGAAGETAPDWGYEVGGDDAEAVRFEEADGERFAGRAERQMCGLLRAIFFHGRRMDRAEF